MSELCKWQWVKYFRPFIILKFWTGQKRSVLEEPISVLCCHANFSTNHVRSSERQYRDIGANVLIWFEPVIQSKAYILAAVNFIKHMTSMGSKHKTAMQSYYTGRQITSLHWSAWDWTCSIHLCALKEAWICYYC